MPKQYPDEIKKQVVLSYQNGILIPNLSRRSQISQSTLCRWMNEVFSIKIFIENYAAQRTTGGVFIYLNKKREVLPHRPAFGLAFSISQRWRFLGV